MSAADAPRDWDDVIDPKWRDKVLIRNPNPSDTMRAIFGAMIWRFYKDTGSPEGGYDWLRKLDANVHEYTADGTLLMQKLARREGLVTLWDMPDVRLYKEQKNLPVGYTFPASGTPVIIDGIAIIRGATERGRSETFLRVCDHAGESGLRGAEVLPHSGAHGSRSLAVAGLDERTVHAHATRLGAVAKKGRRLVKILGH